MPGHTHYTWVASGDDVIDIPTFDIIIDTGSSPTESNPSGILN